MRNAAVLGGCPGDVLVAVCAEPTCAETRTEQPAETPAFRLQVGSIT
jgi:hypothetical protein